MDVRLRKGLAHRDRTLDARRVERYAPTMAYGVGAQNKRGFWSADTCHPSRKLVPCSAASKGIQVGREAM